MRQNTEYKHRRALAFQLLARALIASAPDGQSHRAVAVKRARALSEQAEDWYRISGQAERADELAKWRTINGLSAAAR